MWIKICGMTEAVAISAAVEARVDAIGFVFAPSVRQLAPAQAAQLAAEARRHLSVIAVTLHPQQDLVDEIVRLLKPDALQSDLADFDYLQLPSSLPRLPVLRTGIAWGGSVPRRFLFEGERSGSGQIPDWEQAAQWARAGDLVLAGGLTTQNVAAAVHAVRPYGVDVSSGVESAPGRKSAQKIAEFVLAARAALNEINHERKADSH